jgi:hypothetical protein
MARLSLDEISRQAKNHKQSPEEKRAQRMSLVRGVRSHKSTLSDDRVQSLVDEFEGLKPTDATASR